MELDRVIKERYSCRSYSDQKLSKELIDELLDVIKYAPTAKNKQAYKIYVVQSDEKINKLNELSKCIYGANTVLIFCYDKDNVWKSTTDEGVNSGIEDVSIVATHVMLKAYDMGLGTCWVNLFSNSKLKEEFNLDLEPVLIMPVGYPSPEAEPLPLHFQSKSKTDLVEYL